MPGGAADDAATMRRALRLPAALIAAVLLAAALIVAPAAAGEAEDRAALDQLFAQLRLAPDAETAHRIDQQIWLHWTTPSDPVLAARMSDVLEARRAGDGPAAIEMLDRLVVDFPDYAEGWNQRATLNFMTSDFDASLADIDTVLRLEPRHFGALSGRALIYLQQGKRALAVKDMAAALQVHPFLNERFLFPELAQDVTRI